MKYPFKLCRWNRGYKGRTLIFQVPRYIVPFGIDWGHNVQTCHLISSADHYGDMFHFGVFGGALDVGDLIHWLLHISIRVTKGIYTSWDHKNKLPYPSPRIEIRLELLWGLQIVMDKQEDTVVEIDQVEIQRTKYKLELAVYLFGKRLFKKPNLEVNVKQP